LAISLSALRKLALPCHPISDIAVGPATGARMMDA
jgi:hypothetical protein